MKILLALCFLAALAQATDDIDWTKAISVDGLPENMAKRLGKIPTGSRSPFESRVVGGQPASREQVAHQVVLLSYIPSLNGTAFCGASIVCDQWVLTAAHCIHGATVGIVFVGSYDLRDPNQETIPVSTFIPHEQYNPSETYNDIGLVRLEERIVFNEFMRPIRLASREDACKKAAGKTATICGWGKFKDSIDYISPIPRCAEDLVISNHQCNHWWHRITEIKDTQICLNGANGRSPCSGDSGGPLILYDKDGKATQIGITSFGISSGCEKYWPSVFTCVSKYWKWISSHTDCCYCVK